MVLAGREDFIRFLSGREAVYSFLGRIFEREVDRQLLESLLSRRDALLKFRFITDPSAAAAREGFEELCEYLSALDRREMDEKILELAADFANLFLGVGYAFSGRGVTHPSESAYVKGYLYSDIVDEVFEAYLEEGLLKSPDFHEPEDHIALELYFMAHLCRKAMASLNEGRSRDLIKYLNTQKNFLFGHLLRWALNLAEDIIKNANTPFYRAAGKILRGFLIMEERAIDEAVEWARTIFSESPTTH